MAEVPTLVFPGPSPLNNPNDNYCSNPNPLCVYLVKGESTSCLTQILKRQKVNLVVDCHVACHAPIVSGVSTVQRAASQEPSESQSSCLAPRSSAIRRHGFSEEVAA